jgi:hypothetical protein
VTEIISTWGYVLCKVTYLEVLKKKPGKYSGPMRYCLTVLIYSDLWDMKLDPELRTDMSRLKKVEMKEHNAIPI